MPEISELNTYATRGAQMFLRFDDNEIARLSRFGEQRFYKAGDMLARVGEVGPGLMLIISGQVGVAADGSVPNTGEGQITQTFANLRAVLEANGMAVTNLVKTTVFLTDRSLLASFRAARDAVYGGHAPCSTLLFVAGLADPRFVVEIEAEAIG